MQHICAHTCNLSLSTNAKDPSFSLIILALAYNEACCMHLTPGVVHNSSNVVGVQDGCPLQCTTRSQIAILKIEGDL